MGIKPYFEVRNIPMAADTNFKYIINLVRALMYLLIGVMIIFMEIPLFKNQIVKIILGVLFILYSFFRFYQAQLQKKRQSKDPE
jgi:hypothetical protein